MRSGNKIIVTAYILDRVGMWTSGLCAVHCIALPILLTFSAFKSLVFFDDFRTETIILVISVLFGASSLFPAYLKHHKKILPILFLLSGLFLIGLSRFMGDSNESVLASSGAFAVASAHFINYRLCRIPKAIGEVQQFLE